MTFSSKLFRLEGLVYVWKGQVRNGYERMKSEFHREISKLPIPKTQYLSLFICAWFVINVKKDLITTFLWLQGLHFVIFQLLRLVSGLMIGVRDGRWSVSERLEDQWLCPFEDQLDCPGTHASQSHLSYSQLFMIWLPAVNAVAPVNLFQQNNPHQLMRKCHFRKTERIVWTLQNFLAKP